MRIRLVFSSLAILITILQISSPGVQGNRCLSKSFPGQSGGRAQTRVCPTVRRYKSARQCRNVPDKCASDNECTGGAERCCPTENECFLSCQKTVTPSGCPIPIDLALLLDSSGSIGRENWKKVQKFAKDVVDIYDISEKGTHIAILLYSTTPVIEIGFNKYKGAKLNGVNIKRDIDQFRQQRGLTYIDRALDKANKELFTYENGMRKGIRQVALVLTDGIQTKDKEPFTPLDKASEPLKEKGINIYSLAVGSDVDVFELIQTATRPDYVFSARNFDDLSRKVTQITDKQCKELYQRGVCPPVRRYKSAKQCKNVADKCASDTECLFGGERCCPTENECFLSCQKTVIPSGCPIAIDLALLLDSSGSIGRRNWMKLKKFAKDFVDFFHVSEKGTHIAILPYSTNPVIEIGFNKYKGAKLNGVSIKRDIDQLELQKGLTCIDKALDLANRGLFTQKAGMRKNKKKICLVVTDGEQTKDKGPYTPLEIASQPLKDKGIDVYSLGIGKDPDNLEMIKIASTPEQVLRFKNFDSLTKIRSLDLLKDVICKACEKVQDVIFGIPDSRSISKSYFGDIKGFFYKLTTRFSKPKLLGEGVDDTNFAIVRYNSYSALDIELNQTFKRTEAQTHIKRLVQKGNGLDVATAIQAAADLVSALFGEARQTTPKTFVLFVPQNETAPKDVITAATKKLKNMGVRLLFVGLQDKIVTSFYKGISSQPSTRYVVTGHEMKELSNAATYEVADTICRGRYGSCPVSDKPIEFPANGPILECQLDEDCNSPGKVESLCCYDSCGSTKCTPVEVVCSFDKGTLCGWTNKRSVLKWELVQGKGPKNKQGNTYIFINSSKSIFYDEKALLSIHDVKADFKLEFYYIIYGQSVESLSVVVEAKHKIKIVWHVHGSQGHQWRKGCINLNHEQVDYDITFEGTIGSSNDSTIGLDEIKLSPNNSSCNSDQNMFGAGMSTLKSANCSFSGSFCGWRIVSNKIMGDGLRWTLMSNETMRHGIYTNLVSSSQGSANAYLASPTLKMPHCLNMTYSVKGNHSSLEVVLFKQGTDPVYFTVWNHNGTTKGNAAAVINLPYGKPYQVLIIGRPCLHNESDIEIYDVMFKSECGNELDVIHQADCDFEEKPNKLSNGLCLWYNDKDYYNKWTHEATRSAQPWPGNFNGNFVISFNAWGSKPGEKAQLFSPWIRGEKCMEFKYFLYGYTIGCLSIYAKSNGTMQPLWIKSGNRGKSWNVAEVYFDIQSSYQIVIETTKGKTEHGKLAIDDILVKQGQCTKTEVISFVLSYHSLEHRFAHHSLDINGYTKVMQFEIETARNTNGSQLLCFYGKASKNHLIMSNVVSVDPDNFPLDCFYSNSSTNSEKVFIVSETKEVFRMTKVNNQSNYCCGNIVKDFSVKRIDYYNTTGPKQCQPGWYSLEKGCVLFLRNERFTSWEQYNKQCLQFNSVLATLHSKKDLEKLSQLLHTTNLQNFMFLTGYKKHTTWMWKDDSVPLVEFWSPDSRHEYENCVALSKENSRWSWVYADCLEDRSFLCEEQKEVPNPIAVYTFNSTKDFLGTGKDSSISRKVPVTVRKSISIAAKVFPGRDSRLVISFKSGLGLSIPAKKTLQALLVFKRYKPRTLTLSGLKEGIWNDVGLSYDYSTGIATLWIGNNSTSSYIGEQKDLDTDLNIYFNRSFESASATIADARIYDNAIEYKQPTNLHYSEVRACRPTFIPVYGRCFQIQNKTANYSYAEKYCKSKGANLARVDREYVLDGLSKHLDELGLKEEIFIGLQSHYKWIGMDGDVLLKSSYSWNTSFHFVAFKPSESKLVNAQDDSKTGGAICQRIPDTHQKNSVFSEIWAQENASVDSLNAFASFANTVRPSHSHLIKTFKTGSYLAGKYGQRLSSYLEIPLSGDYVFYVTCNDACLLLLKVANSVIDQEEITVVKTENPTTPNAWDRFPDQMSSPVYLHRCSTYRLEAYLIVKDGSGHVGVGARMPSDGKLERPIFLDNLHSALKGNRTFSISLGNGSKESLILEADNLEIKGSYTYCCIGVDCSGCVLYFYLNTTKEIIGHFTETSCRERNFKFLLRDNFELGADKLMISLENPKNRKTLENIVGTVIIQPALVRKCLFEEGICNWLENDKDDCWKSRFQLKAEDDFASMEIIDNCTGTITSTVLPNEPYLLDALCLQFDYSIQTQGNGSLSVRTSHSDKVLWQLNGFQGFSWKQAKLQLNVTDNQKIVFVGVGDLNDTQSVGLANIKISTHPCNIQPVNAKPGFLCRSDEFQCANKACIEKILQCNGDKDCIDDSDEIGCVCPRNQFPCPTGECINPERLCDKKKDCLDSADERNCDFECKEAFQCIDGSCIDWMNTCKVGKFCLDNSHNSVICGSANCTLRNIACSSDSNSSSIKLSQDDLTVPCSFDFGFCGLTQDSLSHDKWLIGKGATPTDNTGPRFDHTSGVGSYIYIEASKGKSKIKARLLSPWFSSGKSQCLQFWYFMYGVDIESLKIFTSNNETETCVWQQDGDHGEMWRFGQTTINANNGLRYQFIIEGTSNSGSQGDIALDDINLIGGTCKNVQFKRNDDSLVPYINGNIWRCLHLFYVAESHVDVNVLMSYSQISSVYSIPSEQGVNFGIVPLPNVSKVEINITTSEYELTYSRIPCTDNSRESQQLWKNPWFHWTGNNNNWEKTAALLTAQESKVDKNIFELHLLSPNKVKVFPKERSKAIEEITVCFWLKHGGISIDYKLLELSSSLLKMDITNVVKMEINSKMIDLGPLDHEKQNTWLFFSVVLSKKEQLLIVYMNGQKWRSRGITFPKRRLVRSGYVSINQISKAPQSTVLSSLNIWSTKISEAEIDLMAYGCGDRVGDIISWNQFLLIAGKHIKVVRPATCQDLNIRGTWKNCEAVGVADENIIPDQNFSASSTVSNEYSPSKARLNGYSAWQPLEDNLHDYLQIDLGKLYRICAVATQGSPHDGYTEWTTKYMIATSLDKEIWQNYTSQNSRELTGNDDSNTVVKNSITPYILARFIRFIPTEFKVHIALRVEVYRLLKSKGKRIVLTSSEPNGLVTSKISTSTRTMGFCLKFRYIIYGAGAHEFQVSIKTSNESIQPVWVDKDCTSNAWKYADIPFISTDSFQVKFYANVSRNSSYVALSKAYVEQRFCTVTATSLSLQPVCRKTVRRHPGFIACLYYPFNTMTDMNCYWTILAPPQFQIRLIFLEFSLPHQEKCDKVFVEVFDGYDRWKGTSLGKFCGFIHPAFVQSFLNVMTVWFHASRYGVPSRGFKASYKFINDTEKQMSRSTKNIKDCPSSCFCSLFSTKSNNDTLPDKVLLEGRYQLSNIPTPLPVGTAALMFQQNRITRIRRDSFQNVPNLLYIDLSSNRVFSMEEGSFRFSKSIEYMRLNNNFLQRIPHMEFKLLSNLKLMDLGKNLLMDLPEDVFYGLSNLNVLSLRSNRITHMSKGLFNETKNLQYLYLQRNLIRILTDGVFASLQSLKVLNLSGNKITSLTKANFQGLSSLEHLDLRGNKLSKVSQDAFDHLKNLKSLKLDAFIYCCYAKTSVEGLTCEAGETNEFSSCEDLLKNQFLTVVIWIMGIAAVIGNLMVIFKRLRNIHSKTNRQSLFLTQLAIADFMMGIYLLIVAVANLKWKGEYFKHDIMWRSGKGCAISGVLSMASSVVSVIMLGIITFERLICTVFPFTCKSISRAYAITGCIITWIVGLASSIIPVTGFQYFYNDELDFGFYGRSSVCLPMQLSPDRYAGWEYAAVFFMFLPFVAFTFMVIAYSVIITNVSLSSKKVRSTVSKRETSLSKRVVFIILTDFLCWMPVIILGMLAFTGAFYDPTKQVYVWVAIVILPINSSINPFLYTFSTDLKSSNTRKNTEDLKPKMWQCFVFNENKSPSSSTTQMKVLSSRQHQDGQVDCMDISKRLTPIKYKIEVVKELNIQSYYDGIGYILAMVHFNNDAEYSLVKYFPREMTDVWQKELKMLERISGECASKADRMKLVEYKWHCSAEEHLDVFEEGQKKNIKDASLICYGLADVESLQEFLLHKELVTIEAVCSLSMDIISVVEYFQKCGISNNNINTKSIAVVDVEQDSEDNHKKAVVVDFTRATELKQYEDGSLAKTDIIQFEVLLKTMLKNCCQQLNEYHTAQFDEICALSKRKRTNETTGLIKEKIHKLVEM